MAKMSLQTLKRDVLNVLVDTGNLQSRYKNGMDSLVTPKIKDSAANMAPNNQMIQEFFDSTVMTSFEKRKMAHKASIQRERKRVIDEREAAKKRKL